MTRVPLKLSFRKFYPGFDPTLYFIPLVEKALQASVEVVAPTQVSDLEFVSVYHQSRTLTGRGAAYVGREIFRNGSVGINESRPSHLARHAIWYSGENLRPPHEAWDATWSFDVTSERTCNVYFPLWWLLFPELLGIDIPSPENRIGREITLDECMSQRDPIGLDRERFLCAFIGNPEPTRMRALDALREVGDVDVYGSSSGKSVSTKWEVARHYRFMLCFENDVWPGYVTEKAFDAWACGCIPVWSGIDREGFLNKEAIINAAELASLDDLLDEVATLERDRSRRAHVNGSPILSKVPNLDAILQSVRNVAGLSS